MQPNIIRAALALLGWQQRDLAAASGVSLRTVENILADRHGSRESIGRLRSALRRTGVVFIDGENLQGVALADPDRLADGRDTPL